MAEAMVVRGATDTAEDAAQHATASTGAFWVLAEIVRHATILITTRA